MTDAERLRERCLTCDRVRGPEGASKIEQRRRGDLCWAYPGDPWDSSCRELAVDWRARALAAEAHAADTHRQCYDCRADRRLEPTRIAEARADERRKTFADVVAWIQARAQGDGDDAQYLAAAAATSARYLAAVASADRGQPPPRRCRAVSDIPATRTPVKLKNTSASQVPTCTIAGCRDLLNTPPLLVRVERAQPCCDHASCPGNEGAGWIVTLYEGRKFGPVGRGMTIRAAFEHARGQV